MEEDSQAADLAGLISFSNLENVLKHIIRKFKMVETQNEQLDAEIKGLNKELEARATVSTLEEFSADLGAKVDHINKFLDGQKDNLSGLENQLERNRAMCNSIDKKLEATIKEKAVQDRLIRETQDSMQDKVAVAELNMFEAKFAGYTTKLEFQEIINLLGHYTRVDVTEGVVEGLKVLGTRFDDYTRTARIDQQLQELRDWVSSELQSYAKSHTTLQRLEDITTQIRDQAVAFERIHAVMDDKIRGLSDRMTSIYAELSGDINQRALDEDLREVMRDMKNFAVKGETDAFQADCAPKLKFCVDSIKAFDNRLRMQDDAITRVDEILLDKAFKYDIIVVNSKIEQCMVKEKAMSEFQKMYERLDWMNRKLEQYIELESERLSRFKPPDYGPMFEGIHSQLTLKADKADLIEMNSLKANRIDADELCKIQELVQSQLEYLAVTTLGLSKLTLTEMKSSESKTIRTQQKTQVLMQAEKLWHWILHNEPPPNLDTLRPPGAPPPSRVRGAGFVNSKDAGKGTVGGTNFSEKRLMDDQKRMHLEQNFGSLSGS